jgi:hypothetical protein
VRTTKYDLRFNLVTALKVKAGFENSRMPLPRLNIYKKCLFVYLKYCLEMKTKEAISEKKII